ncbi:Gfo/Idh/MocA family protein [Niallia nealsonii]|uniref:Gfo/Idh/MocA family oxidoreductase n=1 Tax=Niallia nealsonii TaxID=115979 RepID=A0A2N0Z6Y1_9BACI|nr:Gfo/Idh/MocA family oxidoreductase [Niallia nealsonii]PKG25271.1 gfo/Idh/MocA family oxidoreductase [Niallia nealsonii]
MNKKVNIGMVGAGWMCTAHVNAYTNAFRLYGEKIGEPVFKIIMDVNEHASKETAKKFGFEKWTTDWMDIIHSDEVDIVDIVTPNVFHYEIAKAALLNGKNVYCEKPLSLSAEESKELARIAKEKGVLNYVAFNNVMNPATEYMKQLVQSGKLGEIMRFDGRYDQDMLLDPSIAITWRHLVKQAGSGALGDLGSHLLSVSQYIMGDIESVHAVSKIYIPERPAKTDSSEMASVETEDYIAFTALYQSGAIGQLSTSRVGTGRKNYLAFEIQGTLGTATFSLERLNEVNVYFHNEESAHRGFRNVLLGPDHGDYGIFQPAAGINISFNDMKVIEVAKVLDAFTNDVDYVCDFEFGAKIDTCIQAILKSAKTHKWEKVEERNTSLCL